jgi:hypothetical protein
MSACRLLFVCELSDSRRTKAQANKKRTSRTETASFICPQFRVLPADQTDALQIVSPGNTNGFPAMSRIEFWLSAAAA